MTDTNAIAPGSDSGSGTGSGSGQSGPTSPPPAAPAGAGETIDKVAGVAEQIEATGATVATAVTAALANNAAPAPVSSLEILVQGFSARLAAIEAMFDEFKPVLEFVPGLGSIVSRLSEVETVANGAASLAVQGAQVASAVVRQFGAKLPVPASAAAGVANAAKQATASGATASGGAGGSGG